METSSLQKRCASSCCWDDLDYLFSFADSNFIGSPSFIELSATSKEMKNGVHDDLKIDHTCNLIDASSSLATPNNIGTSMAVSMPLVPALTSRCSSSSSCFSLPIHQNTSFYSKPSSIPSSLLRNMSTGSESLAVTGPKANDGKEVDSISESSTSLVASKPPRIVHIMPEPYPYLQLCFDPDTDTITTGWIGKIDLPRKKQHSNAAPCSSYITEPFNPWYFESEVDFAFKSTPPFELSHLSEFAKSIPSSSSSIASVVVDVSSLIMNDNDFESFVSDSSTAGSSVEYSFYYPVLLTAEDNEMVRWMDDEWFIDLDDIGLLEMVDNNDNEMRKREYTFIHRHMVRREGIGCGDLLFLRFFRQVLSMTAHSLCDPDNHNDIASFCWKRNNVVSRKESKTQTNALTNANLSISPSRYSQLGSKSI